MAASVMTLQVSGTTAGPVKTPPGEGDGSVTPGGSAGARRAGRNPQFQGRGAHEDEQQAHEPAAERLVPHREVHVLARRGIERHGFPDQRVVALQGVGAGRDLPRQGLAVEELPDGRPVDRQQDLARLLVPRRGPVDRQPCRLLRWLDVSGHREWQDTSSTDRRNGWPRSVPLEIQCAILLLSYNLNPLARATWGSISLPTFTATRSSSAW